MKRARCDSALCNARQSLTVYLDDVIRTAEWNHIDLERNTNMDLVRFLYGQSVKLYQKEIDEPVWMETPARISKELYMIFYDLCE
jgi:hypothetical protein